MDRYEANDVFIPYILNSLIQQNCHFIGFYWLRLFHTEAVCAYTLDINVPAPLTFDVCMRPVHCIVGKGDPNIGDFISHKVPQ